MFDGQGPTWQARLALHFRADHGRTRCESRHRGPLRMQKSLYPEGDAVCHAVVIHPPGGIAGGDELELAIAVDRGAHGLVTTPGATKWYKANGHAAVQRVALAVNGTLEWLPQEAIVFDAADVHSSIEIELGADAAMIGWDIVALGRHAAGERFDQGCYRQSLRLRIDGALQWHERVRIAGRDALLDSPVGLAGNRVFGCLWAAGASVEDIDLDDLRSGLGDTATVAPRTRLHPRLIVARTLASGTGAARSALETVWSGLRPRVCARPARAPRIWAT